MIDDWKRLNIPHEWGASSMLRNLVVDYLGPDKKFNRPLDDETRKRMTAYALIGHIELADKVATLTARVEELERRLGESS